ncbi:MAG: hypothetical protein ABSD38_32170 [Syntrophorhabdales bacterium]
MRLLRVRPRLRLFWFPLLLFVLVFGCATAGPGDRASLHPVYREKIKDWQMRIQREGWSENQVHSILLQFRSLATYRMEIGDHWDTPREFIDKGFASDCKNIAAFEMGALKQLGYPYQVRILIVHALFEDHALLRIELPEGEWKVYDVVPQNVPTPEARLLKPVVEFDEKRVEWYPSENLASYDLRKGNPLAAAGPKETAPPAERTR